jgi:hypothetical protein
MSFFSIVLVSSIPFEIRGEQRLSCEAVVLQQLVNPSACSAARQICRSGRNLRSMCSARSSILHRTRSCIGLDGTTTHIERVALVRRLKHRSEFVGWVSLTESESQGSKGAIALLRLFGLTPGRTSISESQPAQ